eukprot:scaffold206087_cov19-Prasinocladus_malaysianus.AAC.1
MANKLWWMVAMYARCMLITMRFVGNDVEGPIISPLGGQFCWLDRKNRQRTARATYHVATNDEPKLVPPTLHSEANDIYTRAPQACRTTRYITKATLPNYKTTDGNTWQLPADSAF